MQPYKYDEILTESVRDGLVDEVHSGFVLYGNKNEIKNIKGDSKDYPFYLRSCAKPLQAALLIDYGMDKFYDMTLEEIALCTASHAGEKVHTDIVSGFLNRIGLDESYLKCGLHEPLSKTRQYEMKVNNEKLTQVYNNCSGKHAMMLALCKMNNWDLKTYDYINHPLQVEIRKKINELCEVKKDYPITKDGCGVPIFSMPLKNILKGYLNLFCDNKYFKITQAFLKHPYLIGGEDRTDTKVMQLGNLDEESCQTSSIVAKVGAGGLCVVVNIEKQEGFIVKISDCDMPTRELVVFEMLNKLGWCNTNINKTLKTLHLDTVGEKRVDLPDLITF